MAQTGKTFRVFISSTFSDLKEERNALQRYVFPKLRDLCMRHGCRFQAIDLRWGVSDEAALDQQTVKICLEEIARCRKITPRPNFIVFLGDRYGWRPLPSEILASEFEEIERRITNEDKKLLTLWYKRDDNAVPPVYCLLPRRGEYIDFSMWEGVEQRLRTIQLHAITGRNLTDDQRLKYIASATEQEIAHGALQFPDAKEHVYCFFRSIKGLPQDGSAKDYLDIDNKGNPDQESRKLLGNLKERLSSLLPQNTHTYETWWTGNTVDTSHIDKLCKDVYDSLSRIIFEEIAQLEEIDPLEKEIIDHEAFGKDRAKFFIGRTAILQSIADYIKGNDPHPMAIVGESGSGKSALIARAAHEAREGYPDAGEISRFIGATPDSSDGRSLLENFCRQISRRYGAAEATIPNDYKELVQEFPKRVALATAEKPLILFLDALDQLSHTDHARSLSWLPAELPQHVRVIVSTLPGECYSALERKLPQANRIKLEPMPVHEGKALLDLWLKNAGRILQAHQEKEVADKFTKCGLPLYLKLAFEEVRRWKSYTEAMTLSPDIPGIIRDLFKRLSADSNHGEMMVLRSLGYLAAAKNGLTEDELIDVLSKDKEVIQDFLRRSPKSPLIQQLPVVVWSRLYFDLEPYLTERTADGTALMTFYHRQLGEVIKQNFLGSEQHRVLAEYFDKQLLLMEEKDQRLNLRKLTELPYQQTHGEMWEELYNTLTTLDFLEKKASTGRVEQKDSHGLIQRTYTGVFTLLEDFQLALEKYPTSVNEPRVPFHTDILAIRRTIIETFKQAIRLEAHVLSQHSNILWQQIYNRLQWTDLVAPLLEQELLHRTAPGAKPWLRLRSCSQESHALIRTLAGHTTEIDTLIISPNEDCIVSVSNNPFGCALKIWDFKTGEERATLTNILFSSFAISTDGDLIVIGGYDGTLKLWDAGAIQERARLIGHTEMIKVIFISPRRDYIVSGSSDDTLRIWDVRTGQERAAIPYNIYVLKVCAFSPNGNFFVTGNRDCTLKILCARTGQEKANLIGHTGEITTCAISPDGNFVISGSSDDTLRIWDVKTGREKAALVGHEEAITTCAISPNGDFIVSGSKNGTLKIWDTKIKQKEATPTDHLYSSVDQEGKVELRNAVTDMERLSLTHHMSGITTCAISPNGDYVVSGSRDNTLKIWDARTGRERATLVGHTGEVATLAISSSGKYIASGSKDETINIWGYTENQVGKTFTGHTNYISTCAISPIGDFIVSGSWDGALTVWDPRTGLEQMTFTNNGIITCCAISPSEDFIVAGNVNGNLRIWDARTGRERATLVGHTDQSFTNISITTCVISPQGEFIISGNEDGTLKIWDARTGQEKANLVGHTGKITTCAISPGGDYIVSGSSDKTLKIWDVKTSQEKLTLVGHTWEITNCVISSSGDYIVSGSSDDTLRIWDAKTGQEKDSFTCSMGGFQRCAVSPDENFVVAGFLNLKIWDTDTGQERIIVTGHRSINNFAISPDGNFIVFTGSDKTLRIWDIKTGQERAIISLKGTATCLSLHSFYPLCCCGDEGGNLYIVDLIGIEYGPIIVTGTDLGSGPIGRCPGCLNHFKLEREWLGHKINCPVCNRVLKCNSFIINKLQTGQHNLLTSSLIEAKKSNWNYSSGTLTASEDASYKTKLDAICCPYCKRTSCERMVITNKAYSLFYYPLVLIAAIVLPFYSLWWLIFSIPMGLLALVRIPMLLSRAIYRCSSCGKVFSHFISNRIEG